MNDTLSDSALALADAYYDVMENDRTRLEALVDKHGLNTVIELLEEICASRAKLALRHGNQSVADTWYRAAVALDKARDRPEMTQSERDAITLIAVRTRKAKGSFSVVKRPTPGRWYDWACPETGQVGQCCMGDGGKWKQDPRGTSPVVLKYSGK
jgi:hypothetical protein